MGRASIDIDVNMSDALSKRRVLSAIGSMQGLYEVCLKPIRPTRSSAANRRYWRCIVQPFQEFLQAQGQHLSKDRCHDLIVAAVLGTTPVVDENTGQVIGETRPETHTMDTEAFSEFMQSAEVWVNGFGIEVPPELEMVSAK